MATDDVERRAVENLVTHLASLDPRVVVAMDMAREIDDLHVYRKLVEARERIAEAVTSLHDWVEEM